MTEIRDSAQPPHLNIGTDKEIRQLVRIRGLSYDGVLMGQERGLLRFGVHFGHSAWFVLDKTLKNIQARRLDGEKWFGQHKAVTLKGAQGNWPIGLYESLLYPNIAIVEGGPDLIAAHHLLWSEEAEKRWGVIAMLGASTHLPQEAIEALKGKRINIFYHYDAEQQGAKAAYRWHQQLGLSALGKHFCRCGPVQLLDGTTGKDLNDQAHISGDQYEHLKAENMHLVFNTN